MFLLPKDQNGESMSRPDARSASAERLRNYIYDSLVAREFAEVLWSVDHHLHRHGSEPTIHLSGALAALALGDEQRAMRALAPLTASSSSLRQVTDDLLLALNLALPVSLQASHNDVLGTLRELVTLVATAPLPAGTTDNLPETTNRLPTETVLDRSKRKPSLEEPKNGTK